MSQIPNNPNREELDQAVAKRLGRLGSMPVDLSRLDRMIQAEIPRPVEGRMRGMRGRLGWIRAVAALIGIAVLVGAIVWGTSGGPALASPAQMAQLHRDLVAQRVPVVKVDSVDEASQVLAGKWPGSPDLPEAPQTHVMACCMGKIKDKKVACVLLKNDGAPVTMTVAKASDMKTPKSPAVVRDGAKYYTESFEKLNMVSTERDGRWICLIGELPTDRLIDMAARLKF